MHCPASARRRIAATVVMALLCVALPSTAAAYDWPQFNGDRQHSGSNTFETVITPANVHGLQRLFQVVLPFAADTAPIALSDVSLPGGVVDLVFMTTRDGHLIALNGRTGATIWMKQHTATTCQINNPNPVTNPSNPCHMNASPAIDPNRQYIYAYGLDGHVHKHQVTDGAEVNDGTWPILTTTKPFDEKGSGSLSLVTDIHNVTRLYVANGGYPGDAGDYQGHITAINLATGAQHVFNTLCSNQAVHFVEQPGTPDCFPETQSAIWGRPSVVYDAGTDRIYMATGNGTFNPAQHNWGDTVLALNPDGTGNANGDPLDSYTPTNFQFLDDADLDLGSTSPAILPTPPGCAVPHLAVQGGKDGMIRLINLANMSGAATPGPGNTGGEIPGSLVFVPGATMVGQGLVYGQPAVWVSGGVTRVFISTTSGFAGFQLSCPSGGQPSLSVIWQHTGGNLISVSSPLVANGVVYTAITNGTITAYDAISGNSLWTTGMGSIHWESPLVANGVFYMPDQNGEIIAFALPAIASITPPGGDAAGGTPVTITGNGFVTGAAVRFGGTAATSATVVNATTITATTPAHAAGAVDVTVTNPDGTVATLPNGFAFGPHPAPPPRTVPGNGGGPPAPAPPGRAVSAPPGSPNPLPPPR